MLCKRNLESNLHWKSGYREIILESALENGSELLIFCILNPNGLF